MNREQKLAVLEDEDAGFRLSVAPDPRIAERFEGDVALADDALCLHGGSGLTGRELEELGAGRHFEAGQVAQLVTEVLPSLSQRIRVDVRTQRLPDVPRR